MRVPGYLRNMLLPPLLSALVEAGFPSPADDHIEDELDLNQLIVKKPHATFFLRAKGESMILAGIHEGDILVVDRSINPGHNHVVIAALNGELTVKRLSINRGTVRLVPDNPHFDSIEIPPESDLKIFGVVTYALHKVA